MNKSMQESLSRVHSAIAHLREGNMVILTDDISRENEGDLIFPAQDVTPEKINFMIRRARGLVCLSLAPQIVDRLQLPLMGAPGRKSLTKETAFTVSIEAKNGVTTGISAADRAHTIAIAVSDHASPDDLVVPGHIFPLKARHGGVLERAGHTEGSVDLVKLAGKKSAAVICEIMNDDGTMARLPDLEQLAKTFSLPLVSVEDLITYRLLKDTLVQHLGQRPFSTPRGTFNGAWFYSTVDQCTHFALIKGRDFAHHAVHVRMHKQLPLSDVFGDGQSRRGGGRWAIDYGLNLLAEQERAVVVYLSQADQQAAIQEHLSDEKIQVMDPRYYGIGAQILKFLGVKQMHVHLHTSRSLIGLSGFGLEIIETVVMQPPYLENL